MLKQEYHALRRNRRVMDPQSSLILESGQTPTAPPPARWPQIANGPRFVVIRGAAKAFRLEAAISHHHLFLPQWEAADLRDLHRDLQQITEWGFRAWARHAPHTGVIQETCSYRGLEHHRR